MSQAPRPCAHHAARVAEVLRDELAALGVRIPTLLAGVDEGHRPFLDVGVLPLESGFALLRILTDYRRLLKAERAGLERITKT